MAAYCILVYPQFSKRNIGTDMNNSRHSVMYDVQVYVFVNCLGIVIIIIGGHDHETIKECVWIEIPVSDSFSLLLGNLNAH
jgi:hypothetical protein